VRRAIANDNALNGTFKEDTISIISSFEGFLGNCSNDIGNVRFGAEGSDNDGIGILGADFLNVFLNGSETCDSLEECLSSDNRWSYFLMNIFNMWSGFDKLDIHNTKELQETFGWLINGSEMLFEEAIELISIRTEELIQSHNKEGLLLPVILFCIACLFCGILLLIMFVNRGKKVYHFLNLIKFCDPKAVVQSRQLFKILSNDFSAIESDDVDLSYRLYAKICASYYDAVILFDTTLTVISVNSRAEEMFGEDLLGKTVGGVLNRNGKVLNTLKDFETTLESTLHGMRSPSIEATVEIETLSGISTCLLNVTALSQKGKIQSKATIADRISLFILVVRDQNMLIFSGNVLRNEEEKVRRLLSTVLPERILERRLSGECNIFHSVSSASLLSLNLIGLNYSKESMHDLDRVMGVFDSILLRYSDLTRVKSAAGSYLVGGGLFGEMGHDCVRDTVAAGLEMLSSLDLFNMETHCAIQVSMVVAIGGPIFCGILELNCPMFEVYGIPYHQIEALCKIAVPRAIIIPRSVYEFIYSDGFKIKEGKMVQLTGASFQTYIVT
jgi:PAS domain-containing protein